MVFFALKHTLWVLIQLLREDSFRRTFVVFSHQTILVGTYWEYMISEENLWYSKTCIRQPPLKLTLVVDVERWLSYKGTCHVILLAKLHDMYLYKTDNFFHINHYLKSVSKVAPLHRFYCTGIFELKHALWVLSRSSWFQEKKCGIFHQMCYILLMFRTWTYG